MSGFKSPNYTQVPNDLFDELMREMEGAELKVVLSIVRQTIGYHREKVRFSIPKIMAITGLSRNGVKSGAEKAEQRGIIERLNPREQGSAEWGLVLSPSEIDQLPHQPVTPTPSASEGQVRLKESIKEKEIYSPKGENISDDEFWEKKNEEKKTSKPKERKTLSIRGIESAIYSGRKVTEEDRAETAGDTIDSRFSGWRDDSVLIIARTFAEAFGKLPPAAPTYKKEKAPFYYAWREGAEKLLSIQGQGDLKHIIKELGSEYDGGYSAPNPGSIAQMVYDRMNEVKKKEKTPREHKPFEFD